MSLLMELGWGLCHSGTPSSRVETAVCRSASANSTALNSLKASHHTGSLDFFGASSSQCSSHSVPGSSM